MVGLTFALIRSQWAQALTVCALAALAVAAAVAAPVYVDMAAHAIAAGDIAAAIGSERTISATDDLQVLAANGDETRQALVDASTRRDFEHVAPPLLQTPGFGTAFAVNYPAFVTTTVDGPGEKNGSLEFREGFCDHVVLVAGRCVAAPGEVIVSEGRTTLPTSATAWVTFGKIVGAGPGVAGTWVRAGTPCQLAVVGIYRLPESAAPADYWGGSTLDLAVPGAEPVLTDRRTLRACDHEQETQEVVAYPLPGTLDVEDLDGLRSTVAETVTRARGRVSVSSGINGLLSTIERDRAAVALVPASAAVPLLALCWFVLFLAIAYTAQSRRRELGIVKLRGVSTSDQWSLAAAESLTPVFAGAVAGFLLGHVGVWLYGRTVFGPQATVQLTARPWPYAAIALAGAVLAAVVALRRDLRATATELLRRVPPRGARWGDLTLACLLGVVAVVALVQLRGGAAASSSPPSGLALLAPALCLMAFGLFAGAALDPVAARLGARSVHKGRVGLAIGLLHLGRRHTGSRLLAVVVVASALLAFAATAAAAAGQIRRDQIGQAFGADQVAFVAEVRPATLLRTVREVDPAGAYAMAVVSIDPGPAGKRMLAVDTSRLASTAIWPGANGALTAAVAAQALRPPLDAPVVLSGAGLAVWIDAATVTVRTEQTSLHLQATVAPTDAGPARTYDLGALRPGRQTYTADISCAAGCRLVELTVAPSGSVDGELRLTITGLRQTGPDVDLVPADWLGGWHNRTPAALTMTATAAGLELAATQFDPAGLRIVPADGPVPLPVLDVVNPTLPELQLASGEHVAITGAGTPRTLPRIGTTGVLADLEGLTRLGEIHVASREGEVWLGPDAPADAVARLRAAGLDVVDVLRLADRLDAAAKRPSAAGVRFLLIVAVLGLGLGAAGLIVAAGVERRGRADELRALRAQGMSRGQARQAALVGYVGVVGVAALLGWAGATLVWALTGDRLPLVDVPAPGLDLPVLPGTTALGAWGAGAAALILLATILTAVLLRTMEQSTSDRSLR
jgi:putative ABC transport system permease protein